MESQPESVTARIAYAESLKNYAWSGTWQWCGSYQVKPAQWDVFSNGFAWRNKVLREAQKLDSMPQLVSVMQALHEVSSGIARNTTSSSMRLLLSSRYMHRTTTTKPFICFPAGMVQRVNGKSF